MKYLIMLLVLFPMLSMAQPKESWAVYKCTEDNTHPGWTNGGHYIKCHEHVLLTKEWLAFQNDSVRVVKFEKSKDFDGYIYRFYGNAYIEVQRMAHVDHTSAIWADYMVTVYNPKLEAYYLLRVSDDNSNQLKR